MLQTQIELGRIVLPPADDDSTAAAAAVAAAAAEREQQVAQQVEWLLAARRGAAPDGSQPAQAEQGGADAAAAEAGSDAPASSEEADAEAAARHVRAQLADISRSLWGTLSAGTASGRPLVYASRAAQDYSYSAARVEAMRAGGELDTRWVREWCEAGRARHLPCSRQI